MKCLFNGSETEYDVVVVSRVSVKTNSVAFSCKLQKPDSTTRIYVDLEFEGNAKLYVTNENDEGTVIKKDTRTVHPKMIGFKTPGRPSSWDQFVYSVPGSEVPRAAPDANEKNASKGPAKKKARKGVKNVSD